MSGFFFLWAAVCINVQRKLEVLCLQVVRDMKAAGIYVYIDYVSTLKRQYFRHNDTFKPNITLAKFSVFPWYSFFLSIPSYYFLITLFEIFICCAAGPLYLSFNNPKSDTYRRCIGCFSALLQSTMELIPPQDQLLTIKEHHQCFQAKSCFSCADESFWLLTALTFS